jgi:hypothetical protein
MWPSSAWVAQAEIAPSGAPPMPSSSIEHFLSLDSIIARAQKKPVAKRRAPAKKETYSRGAEIAKLFCFAYCKSFFNLFNQLTINYNLLIKSIKINLRIYFPKTGIRFE